MSMRTWQRVFALGIALLGSAWMAGARADGNLLSELASSHVKISTGFIGKHVFVFGSTLHSGDIVIRVTSPDEAAALSRKGRVGPFWLNGRKLRVTHVPGLVYLLANRPLDEIAKRPVLEQNGLTFHSMLATAQISGGPASGMDDWQAAFERLKQKQGLFSKRESDVRIDGGRLFSANFPLPATLPIGAYHLDIYDFRDGRLIAHQSRVLQVKEVGLEHWTSHVALHNSWVFGMLFTISAIVLGLALSMLLRRDHARRR